MTVQEEITKFCRSTSMKGMSRISKSDSTCWRVLWTISVSTFLAIAIWQVSVLTSQYFAFSTYNELKQEQSAPDKWDVFRSFTVCNTNPISSSDVHMSDKLSLSQYYDEVKRTECEQCDEEQQAEWEQIKRELLTPKGYFQYAGKKTIEQIGHKVNDSIAFCSIVGFRAIHRIKIPCSQVIKIKQVTSSEYFNCFHLDIPSEYRGIVTLGISAALFLDNSKPLPINIYSDVHTEAGAVIASHHHNGLPKTDFQGIPLPAGQHTTVKLQITKYERLNQPFGNCEPNREVDGLEGILDCIGHCFNDKVLSSCNCSTILSYPVDSPPAPYCGDWSRGPAWVRSHMTCHSNHTADVWFSCLSEQCWPPCMETVLSHQPSHSTWPRRTDVKHVYSAIVGENPNMEHKFAPIKHILDKSTLTEEEETRALVFMRENLLMFTIELGDYRYHSLKESPKVTGTDLFSQIGGVLNLWSGITLILLVEICELIYRMLAALKASKIQSSDQRCNCKGCVNGGSHTSSVNHDEVMDD